MGKASVTPPPRYMNGYSTSCKSPLCRPRSVVFKQPAKKGTYSPIFVCFFSMTGFEWPV